MQLCASTSTIITTSIPTILVLFIAARLLEKEKSLEYMRVHKLAHVYTSQCTIDSEQIHAAFQLSTRL